MKRTDLHIEGDRYQFDFGDMRHWVQLDTTQDASYYGNWVCPKTYRTASFAEGDFVLIECDSKEEFIQKISKDLKWFLEYGYRPQLDAVGINETLLKEMGFECFIPSSLGRDIIKQIELVGADKSKVLSS